MLRRCARLGLSLLVVAVSLPLVSGDRPPRECPGAEGLYGRIKIVEHFPDCEVKVVEHFPDLRVKIVTHYADSPGEWEMVTSFPDYEVEMVEHFEDVAIEYVEHHPGVE